MEERFPGELATLRADNVRLRRLLELSKEQARAADPDQPDLTGAPTAPVDMQSPRRQNSGSTQACFVAAQMYTRSVGRTDVTGDRVGCLPSTAIGTENEPSRRTLPDTYRGGDRQTPTRRSPIGLYPLGDDDTCWWVAADFDKNSAMLDALTYLKAARAYGIGGGSTPWRRG